MDKKLQKQKRMAGLKLVAMVLIIIALPCYVYFFQPELLALVKSPESLAEIIRQYKTAAMPVYFALNIIQVVCSLPGMVFHMAGGYAFGLLTGFALSIIGVFLGCTCAYFIASRIGRQAVHTLFGEKKVAQLLDQLNSPRGMIILFIGYLIPGMPKDLINYVAGLSDIKYKPFIILCMIGRIPGMTASLIIGNQVFLQNYVAAIIIAVCVLAICGLCLAYHSKIIQLFEKLWSKYN